MPTPDFLKPKNQLLNSPDSNTVLISEGQPSHKALL